MALKDKVKTAPCLPSKPGTFANRKRLCEKRTNLFGDSAVAPRSARHTVLSEIDPFTDEDELRVVIETPRGSRNKYSYDPECDCMQLSTVLPEGMVFPYDFGFVPATLGDDGDPLDILILMDEPVVPGCVIKTRLIGAVEARQKEKGKGWERNDRLIAVATHAQTHNGAKSLADLRPHLMTEIIEFFVTYNKLRDRKFKSKQHATPAAARKLIHAGMKQFKKKHRGKKH